MKKLILLFPLSCMAMDVNLSPAPSPEPDALVRSHPIDITHFQPERPVTPSYSPGACARISQIILHEEQICDAVYHVYFRGNGERLKPSVLPHLKKQISKTIDSPHEDPKRIELTKIALQIRELKERQALLGLSDESSSSSSSILTPAVQELVSDAIAQALEEKEHAAQIYQRNALTSEQKYKLANNKLTIALLSNVVTAACTALITSMATVGVALIVHFTS